MKFARKVAIAVDMNVEAQETLKLVRALPILDHCEIHLVHVFPTITYPVALFEVPMSYPILDDRKSIEESVQSQLAMLSKTLFPEPGEKKILLRCLFSDDPKWKFSEYVRSENIDLVVVATRLKHGIFESSFTQYVTKHTHANVIILKHKS